MKPSKAIFLMMALVALSTGFSMAAGPGVDNFWATDVTPTSFSVIWAADAPSNPDIIVFTDAAGNDDITSQLTISPHPTRSSDAAVVTAAEDNGVMKVQVTGLDPNTTYYFQTITALKASPTDVTYYPDSAPMLEVTTEIAVKRTRMAASDEVPFSNDLIRLECYLPDGVTPAVGALLLADVVNTDYPITGFVGDAIAAPAAFVDLNNLFNSSDYHTQALYGGEDIALIKFMGINGIETGDYFVPRNMQLAEIKSPLTVSLCKGESIPYDGDVDGVDIALYIADPGTISLSDLAADFGRINCP
jgi:hypothetical protein